MCPKLPTPHGIYRISSSAEGGTKSQKVAFVEHLLYIKRHARDLADISCNHPHNPTRWELLLAAFCRSEKEAQTGYMPKDSSGEGRSHASKPGSLELSRGSEVPLSRVSN